MDREFRDIFINFGYMLEKLTGNIQICLRSYAESYEFKSGKFVMRQKWTEREMSVRKLYFRFTEWCLI